MKSNDYDGVECYTLQVDLGIEIDKSLSGIKKALQAVNHL